MERLIIITLLCLFTITIKAQDTIEFDTIALSSYIQKDFEAIVKQINELERVRQDLTKNLILIAKSHGIKPEEIAGWTEDNKSILKKKE